MERENLMMKKSRSLSVADGDVKMDGTFKCCPESLRFSPSGSSLYMLQTEVDMLANTQKKHIHISTYIDVSKR